MIDFENGLSAEQIYENVRFWVMNKDEVEKKFGDKKDFIVWMATEDMPDIVIGYIVYGERRGMVLTWEMVEVFELDPNLLIACADENAAENVVINEPKLFGDESPRMVTLTYKERALGAGAFCSKKVYEMLTEKLHTDKIIVLPSTNDAIAIMPYPDDISESTLNIALDICRMMAVDEAKKNGIAILSDKCYVLEAGKVIDVK